MSFVKLNSSNFSTNSVIFHPQRSFVSSSNGVTGALKVIVNRSDTQKDNVDMREGLEGLDAPQMFDAGTYEGRRRIMMEELSSDLYTASQDGFDNYSPYADPPRVGLRPGTGDFELAKLLDGTGEHKGQIPEYDKYLQPTGPGTGLMRIGSALWHATPIADRDRYFTLPTTFMETGYSDIDIHPRNSTELLIRSLKPGSSFYSSGSRALQIAERTLEQYYGVSSSKLGSKYGNYNCFNFFSTDYHSSLIYPNANNEYNTADNFTIEFYVKVNHNTGSNTIMHLPRDFAVTIITGSEVDERGFPLRYAVASQHGNDCNAGSEHDRPDVIPSFNRTHTKQSHFVLKPETWHHCAIKYDNNFKTLDYVIDGLRSGEHQLTSSPTKHTGFPLVLGSFYSGDYADLKSMSGSWDQGSPNTDRYDADKNYDDSGFNNYANVNLHEIRLWNHVRSRAQIISGSKRGYSGSAAELNALGLQMYIPCLYDADRIRNTTNIITGKIPELVTGEDSLLAVGSGATTGSSESEAMIASGTQATVSPYNAYDWQLLTGSLDSTISGSIAQHFEESFPPALERVYRTPYNTNQAGIGGFANVNIQNFAKDFVNTVFPVTHHMSESLQNRAVGSSAWSHTDIKNTSFISSSFSTIPHHQKRNCFILPCDNGNFRPHYNVLTNMTGTIYITDNGESINTKDIGDLVNILDSRLFFIDEAYSVADAFISPIHGSSIEQEEDSRYNDAVETVLTARTVDGPETDLVWPSILVPRPEEFQSFFDDSDFVGNLVTVITIPQLFYGDKIKPESFELKSYLHTDSKSQIILKDDGEGNLYRSQTSGSVAMWNSVGDIYYNEGMVYIRNPSLYAIGDQNMDISFEGVNAVNSHEINIFAYPGLVNSSSNPNYQKLKPSENENEGADEFVYISTVYLHDDNLNVVGKAKLAQPIVKRSENKFLFRLRIDF